MMSTKPESIIAIDTNPTPVPSTSCMQTTTRRVLHHNGSYKTISFESIVSGLTVRITEDGHMLALDFLSALANGDRKKASQTLARVNSRDDISELLTLRRVDGKQKSRKLVSFSNAIQLLLVLPKRTVSMETRSAVAGVLTDFYEYRYQQKEAKLSMPPPPPVPHPLLKDDEWVTKSHAAFQFQPYPSQFSFFNSDEHQRIAQRQAQVDLTHREMELERQRARFPLDRLIQCMELMERCGPMSDEEQRKFKTLIAEQAMIMG